MRPCTYCNILAITADCGGENCTATVCAEHIDEATGLCEECAAEAKRRGRPLTAAGLCACRICTDHRAAVVADLAKRGATA